MSIINKALSSSCLYHTLLNYKQTKQILKLYKFSLQYIITPSPFCMYPYFRRLYKGHLVTINIINTFES